MRDSRRTETGVVYRFAAELYPRRKNTHREEDSESGHQVRYRFRVEGRDFERLGIFGTPVSSDVTADDLTEALATGQLAVRYLRENPSVSEPVSHTSGTYARNTVGIGIGALMILGAITRLALASMRRAQ